MVNFKICSIIVVEVREENREYSPQTIAIEFKIILLLFSSDNVEISYCYAMTWIDWSGPAFWRVGTRRSWSVDQVEKMGEWTDSSRSPDYPFDARNLAAKTSYQFEDWRRSVLASRSAWMEAQRKLTNSRDSLLKISFSLCFRNFEILVEHINLWIVRKRKYNDIHYLKWLLYLTNHHATNCPTTLMMRRSIVA